MQLSFIDTQQLADLLGQSRLLSQIEGPGRCMTYVLEYTGQDIIVVADSATGDAGVVYPCSSFDRELGGSVHDEARAIVCSADLDDAGRDRTSAFNPRS